MCVLIFAYFSYMTSDLVFRNRDFILRKLVDKNTIGTYSTTKSLHGPWPPSCKVRFFFSLI